MTAHPDISEWMDHFGSVMRLKKTDIPIGNQISIIPDSQESTDEIEGKKSRLIQNYYGKYWFYPDNLNICVSLSPETHDDYKTRSMSFKTLIITLTSVLEPHGAMFLHAATLVRDNEAVLVAASSGGGKSTTASRIPPPWHAPGDECCIVIPAEDGYQVYTLPTWSAVATDPDRTKTWETGRPYRLKAFCILKQDTEDEMEKVGKAQSIAAITGSARQAAHIQLDRSGTEINQQYFSGCYRTAEEMVQTIPVYLLRTTLTGKFWEKLKQELW